jgi:hypothetical protein
MPELSPRLLAHGARGARVVVSHEALSGLANRADLIALLDYHADNRTVVVESPGNKRTCIALCLRFLVSERRAPTYRRDQLDNLAHWHRLLSPIKALYTLEREQADDTLKPGETDGEYMNARDETGYPNVSRRLICGGLVQF